MYYVVIKLSFSNIHKNTRVIIMNDDDGRAKLLSHTKV